MSTSPPSSSVPLTRSESLFLEWVRVILFQNTAIPLLHARKPRWRKIIIKILRASKLREQGTSNCSWKLSTPVESSLWIKRWISFRSLCRIVIIMWHSCFHLCWTVFPSQEEDIIRSYATRWDEAGENWLNAISGESPFIRTSRQLTLCTHIWTCKTNKSHNQTTNAFKLFINITLFITVTDNI